MATMLPMKTGPPPTAHLEGDMGDRDDYIEQRRTTISVTVKETVRRQEVPLKGDRNATRKSLLIGITGSIIASGIVAGAIALYRIFL